MQWSPAVHWRPWSQEGTSYPFSKKCTKHTKHRHIFPAAVHPHKHQLRHQEQYHVNPARTIKYRKSTISYSMIINI